MRHGTVEHDGIVRRFEGQIQASDGSRMDWPGRRRGKHRHACRPRIHEQADARDDGQRARHTRPFRREVTNRQTAGDREAQRRQHPESRRDPNPVHPR